MFSRCLGESEQLKNKRMEERYGYGNVKYHSCIIRNTLPTLKQSLRTNVFNKRTFNKCLVRRLHPNSVQT